VIRAFGILNGQFHPGELPYGVPYPGMYLIDEHGIVLDKFFAEDFTERDTAAGILVRHFGEGGAEKTAAETRYLRLTSFASDRNVWPGNRVTLTLEVQPKPGMHIYAPGVQNGYIPIDWTITKSELWAAQPAVYPRPRILNLPVIHETVPVYMELVHVARQLTLSQSVTPRALIVTGAFRYQACDDQECYLPQSIALAWTFNVEALDRQRAPAAIQHKVPPPAPH
jgi:DsbC/DsbD-like thiol-disulfide interchange protein